MSKGHFRSAGTSVEYGSVGFLFPVGELDATVLQCRDAQLALGGVDGSEVIAVAPTSLATSYFLTQHTLTVVPIDSLSTAVKTRIVDEIDASIDTFDLIQVGKWNNDSPNHSLTEVTGA